MIIDYEFTMTSNSNYSTPSDWSPGKKLLLTLLVIICFGIWGISSIWDTRAYEEYRLGSVHNLRPGGSETFRGDHLFDPASGGTGIFLACVQGGTRKNFDRLGGGGGPEFFSHYTWQKISPKGLKNTFLHVLGGFSPLCVLGRTIIRRGYRV